MTRAALCMLLTLFSIGAADAQTKRVLLRDAADQIVDSFVSIQGAYDAIPEPLTQPYAITIRQTGGLWRGDSYPIRFRQKAGASAANTITLRPDTPSKTVAIGIASRTDTSETFIFDGARWVTIDGEGPDAEAPNCFRFQTRTTGTTTLATFPAIRFVNGASHNVLRYFEGSNGWMIPGALPNESLILFDTSAAGAGNSDNIIEHAWLSGDCAIRSRGSVARPNKRNSIRYNLFERSDRVGVEIGEGTAATEVSSNEFWPAFSGDNAVSFVKVTYMEDSTRISANTFRIISANHADSAITGVSLRPSTANAPGAVCLLSNNYFSNGGSYVHGKFAVSGVAPTDSFRRAVYAIDIQAGTYPVNAVIAHNTVRLLPTTAGASTKLLRSAAFRKTGSNAGGEITILNNIFQNERSGGGAGSSHAALVISDTGGIRADYNSLRSADTLAQIGGLGYRTFTAYRAAYPALDLHSDDSAVLFETPDSHYLSARMKGRPEIAGTATPAVPVDKDGNPRNSVYRGADELAVICDTALYRAAIYSVSGSDACAGGTVWLQYAENSWLAPVLPSRGYIHQWQSRPLSAPAFSDIPGEFSANLVIPQSVYTIYRVKDSCLADNSVRYSNQVAIGINGVFLVIDSVTSAPVSGYTYEFEAHHNGPSTTYYWDFSDRQTATTSTNKVTMSFGAPGIYTATVRTLGDCSEAVSRTFTIADSSLSVPVTAGGEVKVYPNPASDRLIIEGAEGAEASLYSIVGLKVSGMVISGRRQVFDMSRLPAGSYLLKLVSRDGSQQVVRIAKQN